jgi:hypothetical protein
MGTVRAAGTRLPARRRTTRTTCSSRAARGLSELRSRRWELGGGSVGARSVLRDGAGDRDSRRRLGYRDGSRDQGRGGARCERAAARELGRAIRVTALRVRRSGHAAGMRRCRSVSAIASRRARGCGADDDEVHHREQREQTEWAARRHGMEVSGIRRARLMAHAAAAPKRRHGRRLLRREYPRESRAGLLEVSSLPCREY